MHAIMCLQLAGLASVVSVLVGRRAAGILLYVFLPAVPLLLQPSVDVSRIVSQHKKRGRPKLNVRSENVIFSPSSVVTGSDRSVIADPRQFAGHGPTKQLSFLDASPRDTVSNSPTVNRDGAGNLPSEFHPGKLLCH
jgi:hypothetical protein